MKNLLKTLTPLALLLAACSPERTDEPSYSGDTQSTDTGGTTGSGGQLTASTGSTTSTGGAGSASGGMSMSNGASTGTGGMPMFSSPPKLLFVGDSITENDESWIHPVQENLASNGCAKFELIGYDGSPYNGPYSAPPGLQSKRIAAGGFSTRGILNWIESKDGDLGGVPDVWVQYLGVNNEYGGFIDGTYNPSVQNDPGGAYVADTSKFIDLVRSKNPSAYFVLMKIQNGQLQDIDAAIDEVVSSKSTSSSPVVAVDGPGGVETSDGIHPTQAGAETLAAPVSQRLIEVLTSRGQCN